MLNNSFSCPAWLSGWTYKCSYYAGRGNIAYADIWRPTLHGETTSFKLVHKTRLQTKRYALLNTTLTDRFMVHPGDIIGVHFLKDQIGPLYSMRDDGETTYEAGPLFATLHYGMTESQLPVNTSLIANTHSTCVMRSFQIHALVEPLFPYW